MPVPVIVRALGAIAAAAAAWLGLQVGLGPAPGLAGAPRSWADEPAQLVTAATSVREHIDSVRWIKGGRDQLSDDFLDADPFSATRRSGRSFWFWFLVGAGAFLALVLAIYLVARWLARRRRAPRDERPAPVALEDEPPPREPTRALEEPRKTRLIDPGDAGGETESVPPPPGLAAWLVTMNGAAPYRTHVLNRAGVSVIGASPQCDVVIDEPTVSATHARIVARGGTFTIHDEGSANGVSIGGTRVKTSVLSDGTELALGHARIVFKATR
jgi:hypothetical protein